jgi:hypothetical protein
MQNAIPHVYLKLHVLQGRSISQSDACCMEKFEVAVYHFSHLVLYYIQDNRHLGSSKISLFSSLTETTKFNELALFNR